MTSITPRLSDELQELLDAVRNHRGVLKITNPRAFAIKLEAAIFRSTAVAAPSAGSAPERADKAKLHEIAKDASLRAAKNSGAPPQLLYAPILWALQEAFAPAAVAPRDEKG